jgi:hypothetical protein
MRCRACQDEGREWSEWRWTGTRQAGSIPDMAGVIIVGVRVGHVLGTVLLGLAMLPSGRVPTWSAWAITVSQQLHFVATVIRSSPPIDFAAWGLTAAGMAMVARALLKETPTA